VHIGPTKKSRVGKSKRASYSVRISVVRGNPSSHRAIVIASGLVVRSIDEGDQ
jgi:hypothetical protein